MEVGPEGRPIGETDDLLRAQPDAGATHTSMLSPRGPEPAGEPWSAWFTGGVLALTSGMTIFFGLSIALTSMSHEGAGARRTMVILTVVFGALTLLQVATR